MHRIAKLGPILAALVLVGCGRAPDDVHQTAGQHDGQIVTAASLADLRSAGGGTLQALLDEAQHECGAEPLGFEPGGVNSADLNGDGRPDYLIDMTSITCGGANRGGGWCGSLGCSFDILVSTDDDFHRDTYVGSAPEVVRHADGLGVGAEGRDGPFVAVWNGSEMAVVQTPGEATSAGVDAARVRAVVASIYDTYLDTTLPGATRPVEAETAELRQAVEAAADPETGALEVDYYCSCQDYGEVSYEITAVRVEGRTATASVDFASLGQPARRIDLILRKIGDRWQVDDVREGEASLRETLTVPQREP